MSNENGAKWLSRKERLAIYLRDGCACAYCGAGIEEVDEGILLSLDHLVPRSAGGGDEPSNLITACTRCNAKRQDRQVFEFCEAVAHYVNAGVTAQEIYSYIADRTAQPLAPYRKQAAAIIARRATWPGAIAEASKLS